MRFVVVTGLSGAGKTQALHALEDIGYYCVDNLPPALLPRVAQMCLNAAKKIDRVAVVVDVRGGALFEGVDQALEEMQVLGIEYDLLFLDASDEELARRYKETRRAHPMGRDQIVLRSIARERAVLATLAQNATRTIDTSRLLTRELREAIVHLYGSEEGAALRVAVMSFGFKRGTPQEADIVLDVRFLPNPFYISDMREMTGLDKPVQDYIDSFPETEEFMKKTMDLFHFLIPLYQREGKSQVVIAIGCTGGQHRSVYLAERIRQALDALDYTATVSHRDAPLTPAG